MKAATWACWLALGGCGRLAFDPLAATDGNAGNLGNPGDVGNGSSGDGAVAVSGAVAHFPFDDPYNATGTSFVDTISGQPLASCTGPTCPVPTPGHRGQSYHFNGSNSCAYGMNTAAFNTAFFTIAIWFRSGTAQNASLMAKPTGQPSDLDSWQLEVLPSGALQLTSDHGTGTLHLLSSAAAVINNTWMHAAATWDGMTENLYLNGVRVGSQARSGAISYDATTPIFACDNNMNADAEHLTGEIDELWIFDRALSQAEIQQLAAQ